MITKAKKVQFTTSDGEACQTLNEAKIRELYILSGAELNELKFGDAFSRLVDNPREAIAILRLGLPRKPRTVKPKSAKSKKPAAATQPA